VIPGKRYGPHDVLGIARRRKWLIIGPAVALSIVVGIWSRTLPDQFRSDTLILVVPQRVPESYVKSTVTARIEDRLQSITQQILSRTRLERIIQDFNLYAEKRKTGIMEDIVERMRKDIEVQIVKGDAFRVSFIAEDARTAMKVTERLASLFIEENLRDREVLAEGTNQFLEAQLEDARRRLIDNEKKLEDYRRAHSGEMPKQQDSNLQGLHNVEMQLQALIDSVNRDRDAKLTIERVLADAAVPDQMAAAAAPPAVSTDPLAPSGGTTADQLQVARGALRNLELRLAPAHPDVQRMKRIISDLQQKLDTEESMRPVSAGPVTHPVTPADVLKNNRLKALTMERENLDRQIANKLVEERRLRAVMADYQKKLEAAPTREAEMSELSRDYETLQTIYRTLLSKKEDSKVAANLERRQIGEQFKILDPARLPEKPTSPDRPRIIGLGLALALAIALAIAALVEYENETMRSEEDVRYALNLPVLATIPLVATAGWRAAWRWRLIAASATAVAVVGTAGAFLVWRMLK
jgi:polysaccharide chain length determinant protein (PEP-CTERM system associated)